MKNLGDPASMDASEDWVFSFDFRIEIIPGDTYGNDTIMGSTRINDSGDIMAIHGAGDGLSSFLADGTPDQY